MRIVMFNIRFIYIVKTIQMKYNYIFISWFRAGICVIIINDSLIYKIMKVKYIWTQIKKQILF